MNNLVIFITPPTKLIIIGMLSYVLEILFDELHFTFFLEITIQTAFVRRREHFYFPRLVAGS